MFFLFLHNENIPNFRELESAVNTFSASTGSFNLGNTSFLAQETSQERQILYSQLVNSYKWIDKIHDHSYLAHNVLTSNNLKRSCLSKRGRMIPPTLNNANSIQHLESILKECTAQHNIICKVTRPFGSNGVIILNIGRVFKAAIICKGLVMEWVTIKGWDESLELEDLWTESRYQVFQKVQDHCHVAMLHFFSTTLPHVAVKCYMTYLHNYNKLFTDVCKKCGKHLSKGLPPTWRDLRNLEPYHEECWNG